MCCSKCLQFYLANSRPHRLERGVFQKLYTWCIPRAHDMSTADAAQEPTKAERPAGRAEFCSFN